jgi:acyl-CoA synthetase (AMP-forming)/AMP-acid ligase II
MRSSKSAEPAAQAPVVLVRPMAQYDRRVSAVRLADLLRDHARERPDALALIYEGSRMSFAELDERTNRLAQALLDASVKAGSRVAHLDQNAPECVELLFGAAKAGAVLVPLNWRLAKPELEAIVDDADAAVLVCGADYAALAKSLADKVIVAGDEYEEWISSFDAKDPGYEAAADGVALQLYTSGTTGRPKGVLTTNANLDGLTKVSERWSLDGESMALVAMPLFHIGGVGWLLVALAQGAACVLIRSIEPAALLDTMVSEGVTNALVEEALASHGAVGEVAVIGLPDERWGEVVTAVIDAREGGETDEDQLVAHARERLAGYKLPRRVHVTDELPKTATGKVLKRELRKAFGDPASG